MKKKISLYKKFKDLKHRKNISRLKKYKPINVPKQYKNIYDGNKYVSNTTGWIFIIIIIFIAIILITYFTFYKVPVSRVFICREDVKPNDWLLFWGSFISFLGSILLGIIALLQNSRLHRINVDLQKKNYVSENYSNICSSNVSKIIAYQPNDSFIDNMKTSLLNTFNSSYYVNFFSDKVDPEKKISGHLDEYFCLDITCFFRFDEKIKPICYRVNNMTFNIKDIDDYEITPIDTIILVSSIGNEKNYMYISPVFNSVDRKRIKDMYRDADYSMNFYFLLKRDPYACYLKRNQLVIQINYQVTVINELGVFSDFSIITEMVIKSDIYKGVYTGNYREENYQFVINTTKLYKLRHY